MLLAFTPGSVMVFAAYRLDRDDPTATELGLR
jgi:hypothetical protein